MWPLQDRQFLSTLSLRRATPTASRAKTTDMNFYPRSPCGERRLNIFRQARASYFYPRSPCGERHPASITPTASRNFYPRSPCGERLWADTDFNLSDIISIHALLAESDLFLVLAGLYLSRFLSTLSLRRATSCSLRYWSRAKISIHALLAESDAVFVLQITFFDNFYPRSPCGERPSGFSSFESPIVISIHALLAESDLKVYC